METTNSQLFIFLFTCIVGLSLASMLFRKSAFDPAGQHCYVTGGSRGLGLALAIDLVKKGAHVSIIAKTESRLKSALEELEKARQNPGQILQYFACSLDNDRESEDTLRRACEAHGGRCPDTFFLCAGSSKPGFFVEETPESMRAQMDGVYWVSAYTALAATKFIVREKAESRIVFVSSVLGYFSFIGYANYASAKFALRGLAESLRSELLLYNTKVHIYFPGTIYSPGYEEENKTKPAITLRIEESEGGLTPEACSKALLEGIEDGDFHITDCFNGHLFRCSTRGCSPHNNWVMDRLWSFIGSIGLPIWRMGVDRQVRGHRQEHQEYLTKQGFFA